MCYTNNEVKIMSIKIERIEKEMHREVSKIVELEVKNRSWRLAVRS